MSHEVRPVTATQDAMLQRWRALALQRMPYFSPLLFEVVPFDAPGLGTFAVDRGWRLYIDFADVAAQGDLFCSEALLHEVGHLYQDHAGRADGLGLTDARGGFRSQAQARRSNVAADAELNDDLRDAGCAALAKSCILPQMLGCPDYETYEFYYRHLTKAADDEDSGRPQDGGDGPGVGEVVLDRGCGSGAGSAPTSWEAGADRATPAVSQAGRERALTSAALQVQQAAKSRGDVPAGLLSRAERVLAPPAVPWQQVLAAAVRRGAGSRPGDVDTSWSRRNRRRRSTFVAGRRVVFPGEIRPTPRIAVVRDTSGSMGSGDMSRVSAEVEGIARRIGIRGADLLVIDTDAEAYDPKAYRAPSTLAASTGGGGTDMQVGIAAAVALVPRPNAVVVITDGETPWPDHRPKGVAVIACIVAAETTADRLAHRVPGWIRTVTVPPVREEVRPTR